MEQLFSGTLQLLGESDIGRSILQGSGQQLTAFGERPSTQIGPVEKEQIERIIDERSLFGLPVGLKELEGSPPLIVEGRDLAVDRRLFGVSWG